ncbi:S9 family peptidase [Thalassotalea piscium]|uniref:Oligopeptidase B n=1 Tax=Thalassotalea piscium TaxID=1230533 RepID=A0A7X0NJJ6_9GAMM|nr:S9 family peptidase [Thalassotalea piscium]MBB6544600.1 oligopeptidase B [Thalassotalea piscium]
MKKTVGIGMLALVFIQACSQSTSSLTKHSATNIMKSESAPIAKRVDHLMEIHDHQRNDPYYWLRDDSREDPEMLAYLNAENNYTQTKLAHTQTLQNILFKEMTSRLEPNDASVPVLDKGYWYSSIFQQGKDYRIIVRQKGSLAAPKEVLIDQNIRAQGHDYYNLGDRKVSPNQKLLAIAEDTVSRRLYNIRIKDIASDTYYPEVLSNASANIVWANDNKTLFYVKKDPETLLPYQVYRHTLGTSPEQDVLVYQEDDNTFYTYIYKTRSDNFIAIGLSSTMNSETLLLDAEHPTQAPKTLLARSKDHLYRADHINDYFYIHTNKNALNGKIVRVHQSKIGDITQWQTVLKHNDDTLIQDLDLFDNFFTTNERINGLEKLRIRDYQGNLVQEISFTDEAYSSYLSNNPDPTSEKIRYYYSSMTTPNSVFEYDTNTQKSTLLKQDKVLGVFDPSDYQSKRILITARDGAKIPVSLVYRKSLFSHNATNPMLVYGYGSYGSTNDPSFSISRLSLLDRGFVYAIAHIRGSKMLGEKWYEDGKKLTKMNSFTDFIDVTKGLIAQQYADPNKVYASGRSAGGLLMGAVVNMAPELYHGVLAGVPFVDVVTTMLDETIPLTTGEYDEWGNPNDKQFYDYMLSYSPYDQVSRQAYPNMLVTTGLHDSQVQYYEPAKWVAKLRAMKTDDNLLLLDTDMEVGHGGKSGRYKSFLDIAKQYSFILSLAGVDK